MCIISRLYKISEAQIQIRLTRLPFAHHIPAVGKRGDGGDTPCEKCECPREDSNFQDLDRSETVYPLAYEGSVCL